MKDSILILSVVFNFVASLSDSQLKDLVDKNATLKLVYKNDSDKKKKPSSEGKVDFEKIYKELELFSDTTEAINYLTVLKMKRVELEEIARKYNVPVPSKEKNEIRIKRIVENVIGSKLTFNSLMNLDLKK